MKLLTCLSALTLCSCYTSHTTYSRGTWTRTVAIGPGASIKQEAGRLEVTTRDSPGGAMAGGAFVGAAVGSFLRTVF